MNKETKTEKRAPRDQETRETKKAKTPWKPPSMLEVPSDPPAGTVYRWVRTETLGQEDRTNVSKRFREGWEPVKPEELGGIAPDVSESGKHKGTVRSGDLILMKVPQEIVDQRDAYYQEQSERMAAAYNQDLKNASTDSMPVSDESKTTYSTGPRTTKFED